MDGDVVRVRMLGRRRGGGGRCGEVTAVLERATARFVGRYWERDGRGLVTVDRGLFEEAIAVGDPGASGAVPGDQVVIEMLSFPTAYEPGEGVIVSVLGRRGDPGVDLETIIREYDLPVEFPEEVLEEARRVAREWDEADIPSASLGTDGREDFTGWTVVTIDPVDARDFDDAISLEPLEDGRWRLGVHIADVSHFVAPRGALDREARRRGTSVYLPGCVIPMLPELLSNGLASLQQQRVRFVLSVLMHLSADGRMQSVRFARAAIRVARRFSYDEVSKFLANPRKGADHIPDSVRSLLVDMHTLSRKMRARRFAEGAIELHLPEVRVSLDSDGGVQDILEVAHDESHQLIEEFMLAANRAVASELTERGLVFLRRVHPSPSLGKLRQFATFAEGLGFRLDRPQSRPALQKVIDASRETPLSHAVNFALLRSFKQAEYTGRMAGHYALAAEDYCHFTSPIRRYPDLIVHRMVSALARGRKPRGLSGQQAARLGRSCSLTERRAEQAERALVKLKLLQYASSRRGDVLDAVVIGVEKFGVICRGTRIPLEALVHVSELADNDYFDFDRAELTLTARRSGRSFRLGDQVRVKIVDVDLDQREVRFAMDAKSGKSHRGGTGRGVRRGAGRHTSSGGPPRRDHDTTGSRRRGRGKRRRDGGGGRRRRRG